MKALRPRKQSPMAGEPTINLIDGEEWRPVVGYEGIYEVSSLGRVKSCARELVQIDRWGNLTARKWPERLLKQTADQGRYAYGRLQVKLCGHGKQITRLVHQLVAEAFIGPRPEGCEVAHNDGNPAHNWLGNLRYATPAQNTADKAKHGTVLRGEHAPSAKLKPEDVRLLRSMKGRMTYQAAADRFGISITQAWRIQNGVQWGGLK